MKKLLLATHNKAKLNELKLGIKQSGIQKIKILSLDDLYIKEDPEETGKTFEENAILKAKYYGTKTGIPTIADDGGLMIDILNGEPGVKSKRWMGHNATDKELIAYTLNKLNGLSREKRSATLKTCLCFFDPKTKQFFTETKHIRGYIAEKQSNRPTHGYPYRALFIVSEFNKYYDELADKEHKQINHRLKALAQLLKKIIPNLLQ